jgi:hypothetical protein
MKKTLVCNPFFNVSATGLAVCDLNNLTGNTIESINLTLGGTALTKAMLTAITVKVNGKIIFETDGTKLDLLEQFKGYTADATHLAINFMELKARTPNSFTNGSWLADKQSGIVNIRLEVQITGATAPTLTALAEVSEPVIMQGEQQTAYILHRRHRATFPVTATGVKLALPVPHLDPAGGGSIYKRIAIYNSNMTAIQVVRGGLSEFDGSVGDLAFMQRKAGRVPQTGLTVYDPVLDNMTSTQVMNTTPDATKSAQVYGTFSATETITIETEELLPLGAY